MDAVSRDGRGGLSFVMTAKILQRLIPTSDWLPFLTLAFVGFSPLLVRNSLSIMADAPALGAMLTAIWLGICFEESGKMVHFLAAAFFAGFAVMLRYPVALALFFPVLNWLWIAFRRKTWWGLIFFLPCFAFAALPQLLLPNAVGEGLTQPFQHQHFLQWSFQNFFGTSFFQKDGYNSYPVFNLGAALGPFWHPRYFGLGILAVFGLIFYRKFKLAVPSWWIFGAIAANVLFLSGIPFQNPRFLLPVLPFVAVLFAPIWVYAWDRLTFSPNVKKIAFAAVLCTQMALCWWSCRLIFDVNAYEKQIAATLLAIPNDGQRLYELSFEAMLKARKVPLQEVNMWYGPLPEPRVGDLVLFNLTAFEQQFAGMWPMKNWEMLQRQHRLKVQTEWKEGWKLYVVE